MQIQKLNIKNVGLIGDESIEINKPLLIFYGDVRQGKSTILNSVRWVCGGEFPQDIIKHGQKEAKIELVFDGGVIARSFYKSEGGQIKARAITFVKDGKPVSSPAHEIKRLLNPFFLDQDFLVKKSELERRRYFAEMFAVDTTEIDAELVTLESDASTLRAEIKGYGEIDLDEQLPVDLTKLQEKRKKIVDTANAERTRLEGQLQEIVNADNEAVVKWQEENQKVISHNADVKTRNKNLDQLDTDIEELTKRLDGLKQQRETLKKLIADQPAKAELPKPAMRDNSDLKAKISKLHSPDTQSVDEEISNAGAQNVRADQFVKNKNRAAERDGKQTDLSSKEARIRTLRNDKVAKLKEISQTCGVTGLEFDESGDFIYQGATAGMLSTSQLMDLSSALSSLYPEGFNIELLDRGESLGKSIFEYVKRAEKEKKTILATVVGEKPATVPSNVGVFVVENGRLL
jgi:DNA repair exonuclease SbcCD ATPase subunit